MHCHPLSVSAAVVLTLLFTPAWLVSQWKVFICSLLSLLGRMHTYYLLLLICFPFAAQELSSCDLCMSTIQEGCVVTKTLLFHTHYSCAGSVIGSCTHNRTTYLVCSRGYQHICFNPTYHPQEQWLEIRSVCQVFSPDKPVSLLFDACAAIDRGGCGGTGCGCGGLARERAYTSNDKCMCGETTLAMWWCGFLLLSLLGLCFIGHMAEG
jgi:hypothetical protein